MMNGMEKSDSVVVAVKSTNKGTRVPAEPMEPRTEPKGNPGGQSTRRTQCRESAPQAAERIRQFVRREPRERLTALLHHVTVDALCWAFFELKRDRRFSAAGAVPACLRDRPDRPRSGNGDRRSRVAGQGPRLCGGVLPGQPVHRAPRCPVRSPCVGASTGPERLRRAAALLRTRRAAGRSRPVLVPAVPDSRDDPRRAVRAGGRRAAGRGPRRAG